MRKRIGTVVLLLSGLTLLVVVLGLGFESDSGWSRATASGVSEMPTPDLLLGVRGAPVAALIGMERSVKSKRADELTWEQAEEQMSLYGNDSVRTFARSWANILFGHRDVIEVDENTLIVITAHASRNEDEISMALLSPGLLDRIAEQPLEDQERLLQEAMASREVHVLKIAGGGADGEGVRVGVKTLSDDTNALVSRGGTVKVIGPDGTEIILDENMATILGSGRRLSAPRALPSAPELTSPGDGTVYAFQRKAPRVELSWRPVNGADAYRIVVARDSKFANIFVDEILHRSSLIARNMEPGSYFWRVGARDVDGIDGDFSATRTLATILDDTPPQLTIAFPPEMFVSPEPKVEVRGKTDQTTRVRINGHTVSVDPEGGFTHTLDLAEGSTIVTIEAIDSAGNVEYGKRVITYRGKRAQVAMLSETL